MLYNICRQHCLVLKPVKTVVFQKTYHKPVGHTQWNNDIRRRQSFVYILVSTNTLSHVII